MASIAPKPPVASGAVQPDTDDPTVMRRLRGPIMVFTLLGLAGLGIYDRTMFAFAVGALLPSGIAWFFDLTPTMVLARTVLPLNLATVVPCAVQIYYGDDPSQKLSDIIENIWVWVLIYASSGFGFILYYFLPLIIRIYVSTRTDKRRRDFRQTQDNLKEEWGNEVGQ